MGREQAFNKKFSNFAENYSNINLTTTSCTSESLIDHLIKRMCNEKMG